MTKPIKSNVKPNVHEKADASANKLSAKADSVFNSQPTVYGSHDVSALTCIKETVFAVDQVIMTNNGLRNAQRKHFKNKSVNFRAKASSIIDEIERFFTDNIVLKQKQGSKLNPTTVNHRNKRQIKVIDRMLVAPQPWSHTDRLDSVDLIDFRAALIDNNTVNFNKYFSKIIDDAIRKVVPTHLYGPMTPKFAGEVENNPLVINNLTILTPNLNEYTIPIFIDSISELFPGNQISHTLNESFDDRWIDGSIDKSKTSGPGKSKVYMDGGDDHDSGVAFISSLEVIVKHPYDDKGLSITFLSCPVVSTQLGYNALISSELIELGQDFEGEMPHNAAYRVVKNFIKQNATALVHDTPLNGKPQNIACVKRPLAIGDLSLVANRLQQEFVAFFQNGGQSNLDLVFDTNFNQLPAVARKIFSKYNCRVDIANLYRCFEFFMRNELPGIVQYIADNSAAKSAKGEPCCTGHDDTRITISCSEYKIRAAIRSSLDFKIHQMFDGYRTGTSLFKAMFLFHTPSASMEYAIDIRAELIRIACRNMHDLYSKGYYTRLGATQSFFYDNYVVAHGDLPTVVSYISDEVALNLSNTVDQSTAKGVEKAVASKATSTAPDSSFIPVPDALGSYNPMNPREYQFDIHSGTKKLRVRYGYEFIMNSFYSEFINQLGPNFKVLKDVVIAY